MNAEMTKKTHNKSTKIQQENLIHPTNGGSRAKGEDLQS